MVMRDVFMSSIGFLEWKQLWPADVQKLTGGRTDIGRVFLSPDVHSLHVVWEEGDEVRHDVEDYDGRLVEEFLADSIGDDSYEEVVGLDVFEVISDVSEQTSENTRMVTLVELTVKPWGEAGSHCIQFENEFS